MNAVVANLSVEKLLTRAHIRLMKHPETYLYAGVIAMGESKIVDGIPTARTNGRDKEYGREFMAGLTIEQAAGVVLHEALHIVLKHIPRHRDLMKKDPKLTNIAMDYAVNSIIHSLKDKKLAYLPSQYDIYDPQFHDWSVREIYNFLKKKDEDEQDKQGGGGGEQDEGEGNEPPPPFDVHDGDELANATSEELEELEKEVDQAIHQSSLMAGALGMEVPRAIKQLMAAKIDWRVTLRDFVSSSVQGRDEYTFSRFNRHRIVDDIYMPHVESETIGEVVIAIDTSGSITGDMITKFATELASICSSVSPDKVWVLWWDTQVHGEQVFESNYDNIKNMLKPMGGGGTRVSCVSKYIIDRKIKPDCIIVFTDGYVEGDIDWQVKSPALWVVTESSYFKPPAGSRVNFNQV